MWSATQISFLSIYMHLQHAILRNRAHIPEYPYRAYTPAQKEYIVCRAEDLSLYPELARAISTLCASDPC